MLLANPPAPRYQSRSREPGEEPRQPCPGCGFFLRMKPARPVANLCRVPHTMQ